MTQTLTVTSDKVKEITRILKDSKAKYYPFSRENGKIKITIEDHPVISYLLLMYT